MYMYVVLLLQLSCEMYSFDNDFTLHIYTVHVCTYMLPTYMYVYMYMSTCICISMYHHTMYYVCTCGCGVQGGSTVYVHVHVGVVCRVAVLDVNEAEPVFTQGEYTPTIQENRDAGEFVVQVCSYTYLTACLRVHGCQFTAVHT